MAEPDRSLLARAEEALRLATSVPSEVTGLAEAVLASAGDHDPEATSVARRALGVAFRAEGDLQSARAHLDRSIDVAVASGLDCRAAESRVALAAVAAAQGASGEALSLLAKAERALQSEEAGRLEVQRAVILQRLGRLDEAFAGYGRALVLLRRSGDVDGQARALSNRGVLLAYRGDFRSAEDDLLAAEPMLVGLNQLVDTASVHHNLGFVAARRGDVPAALRWFDQAEREWRHAGSEHPEALLDRCETLLAVRLVGEARGVAATAVARLAASGAEADLAEARVLLSQAALLDGDPTEARRQAACARAAFVAQHRPGWAALARYAALRAAWGVEGDPTLELATEAENTVDDLVAAGWTVPAQDARLIAARIALDSGRPDEAGAQLRLASAARSSGPADVRARAWHAEALVRRARGDGRGADAAVRAGIRVLDRNRATLGATELRVHAAARVSDLGQLGMRMALESGRARRVLAWAERLRADRARSRRSPRPPDDGEVATHLAELRHVVGQLEAAGFAGHDPGRLLHRQVALEAQIRRTSRHATGGETGDDPEIPSVVETAAALGHRALVELVECDGFLAAVTLVDGEARLHRLGSVAGASEAVATLRFALGRLARPSWSPEAHRGATSLAAAASERLDMLLFGPVRARVEGRPLVMVPTGSLHAVPWSLLPACRDRPVAVVPSAAAWVGAMTVPGPAPGEVAAPNGAAAVLVAGPGLAHATGEVADLARVHRPATMLVRDGATVAAFLGAVDGAGLVHVAAHGRFRADNPLLSSLRLADGPLTVYDLERLHRAPRQLVLSACEAGLSAARPGDELLGLASSLLSLGTRVLIASVVPVGDATTRVLMVELHRRLASGTSPAEALAAAMEGTRGEGPGGLAAAGFVCFGAG